MSEFLPPQHRCSTCKSALVNPRNLVVFIDGTANKPGPEKTNVWKLCETIFEGQHPELQQHNFYLEGIGADERNDLPLLSYVGKAIYNGLDVASAMNVEENVKRAYRWLVETYCEGDQIYLFGFSRGAYQVRALAAMIHEVGLLKQGDDQIEQAYLCYLSIDHNNPKTSELAVEFKKNVCRPGVRIHFIGVWDTVSSLGLVKQDVHITASASVTNACHFRHALALDERRVKFMPEYFVEVNALRSNIQSPKTAVSDVKEVWFAGCHGDIGGVSRSHIGVVPNPLSGEDAISPVHAGNVPLVWMGREAAAEGLVFESGAFSWNPEDVDLGREDSMDWYWRILEVIPVRHQISFSGIGKHEWRKHGFRPRLVLPGQEIHPSVFPGQAYTPCAILASGIEIPTAPQNDSNGLWPIGSMDDNSTTSLLTSLLSDQRKTLQSLGEVLFLLNLRLYKGQCRIIPAPAWLKESIHRASPSGLDKFALSVIDDIISNSSTLKERESAMDDLSRVLRLPVSFNFSRALYILCFVTRHQTLRRRFINYEVIAALMVALERIAKSRSEVLFSLVTHNLCYLIDDEHHRNDVIDQLFARGAETGRTRVSLALDAKAPSHLVASLKMIASVAQHQPGRCEGLRPHIINLAMKGDGPVGSAAVGALVKLVKLERGLYNIQFSNILGYLANTLPRLDAEICDASSSSETADLPPVLKVNGTGELDEKVMRSFVFTIQWSAHQRTAATLTILKLCNNPDVRDYCSRRKILEIFTEQLKGKETSLLAAYALKNCLNYDDMWKTDDYRHAAQPVTDMVDKGWFDDAVGRVEGADIFRGLMKSGNLRQEVTNCQIISKLEKKLEVGDHHETRMSLICLEILWKENPTDLTRNVTESLDLLKDPDARNQKRGIKSLSSLAQTETGGQAIWPRVTNIVKMLLPLKGAPPPRHQLFAATAALYNLCKNETIREKILRSREFAHFKRLRQNGTFYFQTPGAL